MLSLSSMGMALLDSVNPMALKLLGYTEQEFARLNFLDLVGPEYRQRLTVELQLLVQRGSLFESVNLSAQGWQVDSSRNQHSEFRKWILSS